MWQPGNRACILGLGLIGGSLAGRLRKLGWVVTGFDRDEQALRYGEEQGLIDNGYTQVALAVAEAQVVFFAVPPGSIPEMARQVAPHLPRNCIVTDVASTKKKVLAALKDILPPGTTIVGGHPMAGSEQTGVWASCSRLLEGATYVLIEEDSTSSQALQAMAHLVQALGAIPKVMSVAEHDRLTACVSHIPHVVAAALCHLAQGVDEQGAQMAVLAAGGFRDTTRVAASEPNLWRDICLDNRSEIIPLLKDLHRVLGDFTLSLESGNGGEVKDYFAQAKNYRDGIFPPPKKGRQ